MVLGLCLAGETCPYGPIPAILLPQGHQHSKHRAGFIPLNLDACQVSGYIRARRIIVSREKPAVSEHPPRGWLWPMGVEGFGRTVAGRLRDSSALALAARGRQAKFISPAQASAFWQQRVQLSTGSLRPCWHLTAFGFRVETWFLASYSSGYPELVSVSN